MQILAESPDQYIARLPEERKEVMQKLRNVILENLPPGFAEITSYGMLGYAVPHSIYPAGYHCDPKQPLPFISIASQKNFIAYYHMGVYAVPSLLEWFVNEYPKHSPRKLDMGKSCIRFKKIDQIPYDLLGELTSKMTVKEWIKVYESTIKL